jgi:hypothetical protein
MSNPRPAPDPPPDEPGTETAAAAPGPSAAADRPESPAEGGTNAPWGLLDAVAQNEAEPDNFPIPAHAERVELRSGDLVKLVFVLDPPPPSGPNAERMWVEVALAHPDGSYEGRLTNQPAVIPALVPSTLIAFEPRHVAGIALLQGNLAFDVTLRAVVSTRALTLQDPPGFAGYDDPITEDDSGWSITAGDEAEGYFDSEKRGTTQALTLRELVSRYPALVEVFQAGDGEWVYRPDHRRYVRLKHG